MKNVSWKLFSVGGGCFLVNGMINFISNKPFEGILFIVTGLLNCVVSISIYKKHVNSSKIEVSKAELDNMDKQLKILIAENKKIEAIRKCRKVTGFGIKEAKEYVESLEIL